MKKPGGIAGFFFYLSKTGNKMAGLFISFEGIDKSGKSTQAKLLVDHLRDSGRDVAFTYEPGSTELGRKIRRLVLDWKPHGEIDAGAEMFLFAADRAQHVNTLIRPALAKGKVVISVRYVDSTLAYQGYGRGLNLRELNAIQNVATGGLMPDITVWVDVDLKTARKRGWGTGADRVSRPFVADRNEAENEAFFRSVQQGYEAIGKAEPNRIFRVDGTRSVGDVFEEIKKGVANRMEWTEKICR